METEKNEVIKDWPEPKSVRNIQVFLGFANFYCELIQGFSKIAASLPLLLKMTKSSNKLASYKNDSSKPAFSKNNGSKPASNKNNGSRPVFCKNNSSKLASCKNNGSKPASSKNNSNGPVSGKNNGNGKVDRFGGDGMEHAKKSRKSKKFVSPKNQLSQEKIYQKVEIHLVSMLWVMRQAF